jgi:hypothetical protein
MGQSIVVTEKPSSNRGIVRFETNRALTGMGHERYRAGTEVWGNRPPDELARRLLAQPSVAAVHVNANIVTIDLAKGYGPEGLREIVENLYRFYPDVDEAAADEAPATDEVAPADAVEPAADEPAADGVAAADEPAADEPAADEPVAEA